MGACISGLSIKVRAIQLFVEETSASQSPGGNSSLNIDQSGTEEARLVVGEGETRQDSLIPHPVQSHSFVASNGWLHNFLGRYGLTLRRTTSTGRDLPGDCIKTIKHFITSCDKSFVEVELAAILAMDQTAIYQDAPGTVN